MTKKFTILISILTLIVMTGCSSEPEAKPQDKNSAEIDYNFSRNDHVQPVKNSNTNAPISVPNTK